MDDFEDKAIARLKRIFKWGQRDHAANEKARADLAIDRFSHIFDLQGSSDDNNPVQ